MASATDAQQYAMSALVTIGLMLRDLPEVANEWEKIPEGERAAWSIDWSNEMSGLVRIADFASTGLLTAQQQKSYREALHKLLELLPLVKHLDLYRPPIPLE